MTGKLLDEGMKVLEKCLHESGYEFSSCARAIAKAYLDASNYDVDGMNDFLNYAYGVKDDTLAKKLSKEIFELIRKYNGVE